MKYLSVVFTTESVIFHVNKYNYGSAPVLRYLVLFSTDGNNFVEFVVDILSPYVKKFRIAHLVQ